MSLKNNVSSCSYCHAYLFDEDDVVYCPVCGAPHHRECYQKSGKCALEEFHGTESQYDKIKHEQEEQTTFNPEDKTAENPDGKITCRMCGEKYEKELFACPKCGTPNVERSGINFTEIDLLGGVPADADIGDGITADEAKRFVQINTPRYIPKFALLNKTNKASWNWLAFLFPCPWFLSRKMYMSGTIFGFLSIIPSLLTIPMNQAVLKLGYTDATTYVGTAKTIAENISEIGIGALICFGLGFLISIGVSIYAAVMADYMYKQHTIANIKKIRAESEDMDHDYRALGGVSIWGFALGILLIQYIPSIIATFIV